jgi:oligopeptide transport system substrate-binding protein
MKIFLIFYINRIKITFFPIYIIGNSIFAKNTTFVIMKRFLSVILSAYVIFCIYSCNTSGNGRTKRVAKGNKVYGGTLRINEITPVITLYPYYIYDNVSDIIACQLYDGLIRLNPKTLSITPDIAYKWEIDTAGTLYTFHLSKGVFFHDDQCFADGKGRKVTAEDFKYSMEALCTASPDNVGYSITFKGNVEGADDYYEMSKKGKPSTDLKGVKVINDSTLQIKLVKRNPLFLNMLAAPSGFVIAKEAMEKYGKTIHIGTGPYVYDASSDSSRLVLTRNPNYFRYDSLGNQLPYIDSVIVTFVPNKIDEFKMFQTGKLDYIKGVPSSQVDKMVEEQISDFQHKPPKYVLARVPEMSTQYYAFNATKAPFNDVRVRKAFNYAIDRTNKIVNEVLEGEAFAPGIHGITPPSFTGYPQDSIKGDTLNVELARQLLTEAGFKDGKGFPSVTLELNSGGGLNTSVAVEIQKELANNLGVNINFNTVSFGKKLQDEHSGKFDMIRTGWIADYPNPSDFLMLFYGGNIPDSTYQSSYYNVTRYKNAEFDRLFDLGRTTSDKRQANRYYAMAEQLMINDAPIMVLWYDQNYSLTRWSVKDLFPNPMNYLDISCVYIEDANTPKGEAKDSAKKK